MLPVFQNASGKPDEAPGNPYRVLVEKYEALLEVQRQPSKQMSLQEELQQSGDFDSFHVAPPLEPKEEEEKKEEPRPKKATGKKAFADTPTDFSEAETLSSGFQDETSNKGTQTDGRPGSFLCTIADGENCKFSIYDDNSTFESRFRKTPEYRQLFSEIFEVLKRAAIAKDDGQKLPLLEEDRTAVEESQVRPGQLLDCTISFLTSKFVTNFLAQAYPRVDDDETDDTQSVMSSVISSAMSEPVFSAQLDSLDNRPDNKENARETALRPLNARRQHDSLFAQMKKKKGGPRKNRAEAATAAPSKVAPFKGGGKKKFRPLTMAELSEDGFVGNGGVATRVFSSKTREAPRRKVAPSSASQSHEYKPGSASEEVAKLRRLEMSYAEALRMPNKAKGQRSRH